MSQYTVIIFAKMNAIEDDPYSQLFERKVSALLELLQRCRYYAEKEKYISLIIDGMAEFKGENIRNATSLQDVERALKVSETYYNFAGFLPRDPEYHCMEEEIIGLMQVVTRGKIAHPEAQERIFKVWDDLRKKYPEIPDVLNISP